MRTYLATVFVGVLAVACGGGSKAEETTAAANPCGENPCGENPCGENPCGENPCGENPCGEAAAANAPSADTGVDWSGWQSWTKLTAEPFKSKHGGVMVDLYVPADHAEAYTAAKGPMAQGMAVVKAQFKKDDPSTLDKLTVMAKMAPGYDADNGDWYYGVLSPDGKSAMAQGKVEACVNCHMGGTFDHLFGVPK
jgi:hypothetical protein